VANTGSAGQVLIDLESEAPGQRRRTGKGHVDSYGLGRVCQASACATQLSRYNSGSVCWLHDTVVLSASHWTR
jgi:hypothetical protein